MKISYNPKSSLAAITPLTAANDDIIFDLYASKLWAKGVRIGADWADISSKPSSLKNPYALTISLNGTSQGPYDGSAAKNINITPGSIGAATSGHNHDRRYLRWNGSTADISAMTWGTLTTANGYTILSHASSSDKGDMGFANKGGQIFMLLDGYYYLKEGQYRVLDTSDFTTFSNIGSLTTRITIGGITKDLKIDADLLDGWHLDSIRKNVGYSWSAKYRINNWSRIIKIDNYSNILLAINFSQNNQASNHLYLISTGYGCGNIVQLGANGCNSNSAIKIRLTENTATSHNVEIYSTYGYNGATELSINCNYTRIDGNSTITTYLTYTAGGGTVRKEITSSYSKIVANLQGNSDTTTKLQTPRQINGTNFDGSANITTSYWGTTRTLTIGNTAKNVDGSGNVSWSLAEIGASPSGHNHDNIYIKKVGDMPVYNDIIISPTNLREEGIDGGGGIHVKGFTGTPFLLWLHDTGNVWYKKTRDGAWKKMDAGHADTAGSVAWNNVTGKPSSFTPSAHTHAWNSLTHSSTIENQAILTNGEANGWKLLTLNIANWDNAANNAHSHSNKSVLDGITSGLVTNWNTAYNFVSTITGTDTDNVINKWDEIVNFLAGITEDNKLNTLLNSKLSIQLLSAKEVLTTKTNNALFWVNTIGTASSITTGPFTDHPYALLSVTNYNLNAENNKFFYRSRLAFSSTGDIKVASCHHENEYKLDETWYNVLTSKNSGINGSTIKLNGTSITVYSSGTADGRYVKKSGDIMTGVLTIDTTNFGALTIKRNDDANGASIQFRGKSSVYGYIGLNNSTKDKLFLRWNSDTSKVYTILDTSSTYTSSGKGVINGTTITQVDNATNADTVDGYHASSLWRSDGGIWNPGANISLNASRNNQEWSFDIGRNGYTGCYWHVWDSTLSTLLKVNADNGKVYAPYNFVGNLEGNASSATKSEYSRCLLGRSTSGSDYDTNKANLVFAEWDTMHDNRWYLKATGYECRVAFASRAVSATSATRVIVNLHTANDINYPLVWSNLNNANNATENQLYKSWLDLYYNPKNKRLFVKGSINTANINATGTVTSAGFKHSGVTENADLYVLTAGGGYTFLNLTSNELAHEFDVNITVTSEWADIEDFYGGNLSFLTLSGTYIVLVYYTTNSANSMYEGYFSGIMSWYTGKTNSNNADEIVLHRVGHAYANTIYLRTRESLISEANPYTKLQISANSDLKQHTYKFKFKRIC